MAVCSICGSIDNHERQTKSIVRMDAMLGEVIIPDITCERCLNCGEPIGFDQQGCAAIDSYLDARKKELIAKLPIGSFYSEKEVCLLLRWDKVPTYRYALFITAMIDNKRFFYKPSIQKYIVEDQLPMSKQVGDGRLNLLDELKLLGIKP
jgi:predicted nucleic acid-binding Zn ribbon protein